MIKNFVFSEKLASALAKHAEKTGRLQSEIVRESVAAAIGKPKLAEVARVGRPSTKKSRSRKGK